MTMQEKQITSTVLMENLCAVLDEISQLRTIFIVEMDEPTFYGDHEFVIGPKSVCESVLGLIDPEYGWPKLIEAEKVDNIMELAPGHRRHPFIFQRGECVAVSIQMNEYERIKRMDS